MLPRGKEARQRIPALDDFEERLLLTEQVLVRAFDDDDLEVGQKARLAELHGGPSQRGDLGDERPLRGDEHLGGTDDPRRDGRALDDAIRIAAHQHAVLEGGRLALRPVGHDVVPSSPGRPHRPPLHARGEAGPTAPAQSGRRDLVDRRFRSEPARGDDALPSSAGEIGIDVADGLVREQVAGSGHGVHAALIIAAILVIVGIVRAHARADPLRDHPRRVAASPSAWACSRGHQVTLAALRTIPNRAVARVGSRSDEVDSIVGLGTSTITASAWSMVHTEVVAVGVAQQLVDEQQVVDLVQQLDEGRWMDASFEVAVAGEHLRRIDVDVR